MDRASLSARVRILYCHIASLLLEIESKSWKLGVLSPEDSLHLTELTSKASNVAGTVLRNAFKKRILMFPFGYTNNGDRLFFNCTRSLIKIYCIYIICKYSIVHLHKIQLNHIFMELIQHVSMTELKIRYPQYFLTADEPF